MTPACGLKLRWMDSWTYGERYIVDEKGYVLASVICFRGQITAYMGDKIILSRSVLSDYCDHFNAEKIRAVDKEILEMVEKRLIESRNPPPMACGLWPVA